VVNLNILQKVLVGIGAGSALVGLWIFYVIPDFGDYAVEGIAPLHPLHPRNIAKKAKRSGQIDPKTGLDYN
jgi:hypothetical protein